LSIPFVQYHYRLPEIVDIRNCRTLRALAGEDVAGAVVRGGFSGAVKASSALRAWWRL
jgi:hypothetical protein